MIDFDQRRLTILNTRRELQMHALQIQLSREKKKRRTVWNNEPRLTKRN